MTYLISIILTSEYRCYMIIIHDNILISLSYRVILFTKYTTCVLDIRTQFITIECGHALFTSSV